MSGDGESRTVSDRVKKWGMRQFWRAQQSQTIISMLFWATTLTLLVFDRLEASNPQWGREDAVTMGVPTAYAVMGSLFFGVILFVLVIGWVYDNILSLWKQHQTVTIERNPFATYLLHPPMLILLGMVTTNLQRSFPDDEEIQAQCAWMQRWMATMTKLEVFGRTVKSLDARLGEPMPEMMFLPKDSVKEAREMGLDDADIIE